MILNAKLSPAGLLPKIQRMWELSARKLHSIDASYQPANGTPVFTIEGRYTARGWTEWTQGFQFGAALLQFDATADPAFLEMGRSRTLALMAPHITHTGVHDHGFNNVSTYGNLLRLMNEGAIPHNEWEAETYRLALKLSGAVQAARWANLPSNDIPDAGGYIYSFNGPHSLFVDTIRSLRALAIGHHLGHVLMGENDRRISLLERLLAHGRATARYSVYYGEGRDAYDVRGRTTHEAIFNRNDGAFRCPNSQQGFSPFTTWTRGLAWAMCGFAEQLEFLKAIGIEEPAFETAARATCDFYLNGASAADGIPYWDTGAPGIHRLDLALPADPFNDHEPVDSSAAAIAAQGLIRFGTYTGESQYTQAGLTVLDTLLDEPYLSTDDRHQGLLLHSVYHRPNGWDHIPPGRQVPCGESSMWGDYHLREAALLVQRMAESRPYLRFWS
jgi:rhamnogalacturonyl hydrolase YesR